MSDEATQKQNAGTRYPFINLEKAIGRAKELFDADQKGREMTIAGAFGTWGYSEKSSGGFQTIGALKMYGLLKDSSGGDSRKVGLTDAALRYFRDEREEEKKKLAREFALKPKLIAALWDDWSTTPPADTIARSHLKTERGLNDQGARSLLAIYKENLAFTELKAGDKVAEPPVGTGASVSNKVPAKVGDYVQWTSNGSDQFKHPAKVTWVAEDGSHLRVHGSMTGIPMADVTVVDAPKPPPPSGLQQAKVQTAVQEAGAGQPDISVLLVGSRLQITADVNAEGLAKLKKVLDQYEQILKLLQ